MDAAEIMTRFVVSVAPNATMTEIAKTLAQHAISGVPVCEADGRLVGIITEGDLVRPLMRSRERRRDWWLRQLAEGTDLAPEFLNYVKGGQASAHLDADDQVLVLVAQLLDEHAEVLALDLFVLGERKPGEDRISAVEERVDDRIRVVHVEQAAAAEGVRVPAPFEVGGHVVRDDREAEDGGLGVGFRCKTQDATKNERAKCLRIIGEGGLSNPLWVAFKEIEKISTRSPQIYRYFSQPSVSEKLIKNMARAVSDFKKAT